MGMSIKKQQHKAKLVKPKAQRRTKPAKPDAGGITFIRATESGIRVDHVNAMTLSAVWCAIRVISETAAMFPWRAKRSRPDGGSDAVPSHRVDQMLHVRPNDEMTPFTFTELIVRWACTYGTSISEIEFTMGGLPFQLWPIDPERITVGRDGAGRLIYSVRNQGADPTILYDDQVFKLTGPTVDGIVGADVIMLAARAIGLGLAMNQSGSATFSGAHPSGFLVFPTTVSKEKRLELLEGFEARHGGARNKGKVGVLYGGMDFKDWKGTNEEMQYVEGQELNVQDVARFFRCPLHKLMQMKDMKYANVVESETGFARDTMVPWVLRMEQEADRKLFTEAEQRRYFTKMNMSAILRGTPDQRAKSQETYVRMGVYTINDVLIQEDLNPISDEDGGNKRLVRRDLIPLELIGENLGPDPNALPTEPKEPADPQEPTDRTRESLRPAFLDAAQRIGNAEAREVAKIAEKAADLADFEAKLANYYASKREYIRERIDTPTRMMATLLAGGDVSRVCWSDVEFGVQVAVAEHVKLSTALFVANYGGGNIKEAFDETTNRGLADLLFERAEAISALSLTKTEKKAC